MSASVADIEELLETVEKNLERVKTLYEQYFLGIQKQAPAFLHTDVERKLRDLTQLQIRNTGLRYRLATLQQKFGAYNSYWKRTLRQIENGTYLRNLSKIGREAVRTGAEIPEEILAAMPKRMREQVVRDREAAIAIAKRRKATAVEPGEPVAPSIPPPDRNAAAAVPEPSRRRRQSTTRGAYVLDEDDAAVVDLEAFFEEVDSKPIVVPRAAPAIAPARASTPSPAPAAPTPNDRDAIPTPIGVQPSRPVAKPPPIPVRLATGPYPAVKLPTGQYPAVKPATGQYPAVKPPTGQYPAVKPATGQYPAVKPPGVPAPAPSQTTRANPVMPGAAVARGDVPVEAMSGPFARQATPSPERPAPNQADRPAVPNRPPPGMTEADVNALYAKYVQAKQMVGEAAGPREREKLLRTIHAQAPKIMEQYKAKGVDFTVVVKDNQVIIRAKPKP